MTARYAIYFVPAPDSQILDLGQRWLGRDVYSGCEVADKAYFGLNPGDVRRLTESAAHYGFHATLKAPFELKRGCKEDEVLVAAQALASALRPIMPKLFVGAIGEFLAILSSDRRDGIWEIHRACLEHFEPYRAALTASDRERRMHTPLDERQLKALLEYGYPYVLEDFRFHMTLTTRIPDPVQLAEVKDALREGFFCVLNKRQDIDAICVLRQGDRNQQFVVLERFQFNSQLEIA